MSRENDVEIANTIIGQLGGYGRLKSFINFRNHMAINNGLSFQFSGSTKANNARITLNSMDTYDIEFLKASKTVKEHHDIYNDQLMDIFEEYTGLYLTLSPRNQSSW